MKLTRSEVTLLLGALATHIRVTKKVYKDVGDQSYLTQLLEQYEALKKKLEKEHSS